MHAVVERLRRDLPATFAELERPFGVGVVEGGRARLVTHGGLPEAVAASCAIPYLFAPIVMDGVPRSDGGLLDRTALDSWKGFRPSNHVALHLVDRSSGASDTPDLTGLTVVRSPRSGARFWNLGDTRSQFDASSQRAVAALRPHFAG